MKNLRVEPQIDREITYHLTLYRGAAQWGAFRAISSLTVNWLINHKPTRAAVVRQLSVCPEQLFNIVAFNKNTATLTHTKTWAQIALFFFT